MRIVTLSPVVVPVAGTAVPLAATETKASSLCIQAESTNVGNIFVGDSTVSSTNGIKVPKEESMSFEADRFPRTFSAALYDLNQIYINATSSGDGVRIVYSI